MLDQRLITINHHEWTDCALPGACGAVTSHKHSGMACHLASGTTEFLAGQEAVWPRVEDGPKGALGTWAPSGSSPCSVLSPTPTLT